MTDLSEHPSAAAPASPTSTPSSPPGSPTATLLRQAATLAAAGQQAQQLLLGSGGSSSSLSADRVPKLYMVLISLHGLVRGEAMELGKDADTGGQVGLRQGRPGGLRCRWLLQAHPCLWRQPAADMHSD
jgi:hypothetical protein